MSALTLNEIEIPVADGGASVSVDEVGERSRALNTFYRLNRARAFRQWKFKTPWITPSTARALRALLLGIGDTWRFDDGTLLSSRGQGATAGATDRFRTAERLAETTTDEFYRPRLGSHCLAMEAATTNLLTGNQGTGTDTLGTTAGFEAATSGGATVGVTTLSSVNPATAAKQGSLVLRVQTDATNQQGVRTTATVVAATAVHAGSVYLRATSGTPTVRVYLRKNAANGAVKTIILNTLHWKRVEVALACTAGDSVYLVVENNSAAAQDWEQDAMQLENQNTLQYATTWQDPASGAVAASNDLDYRLWPEYDGDLLLMCWAKAHSPTTTPLASIIEIGMWQPAAGLLQPWLRLRKENAGPGARLEYGLSTAPHVVLSYNTFTDQEWHHLAGVLRRRPSSGEHALELYVDGVQRGYDDSALMWATGPLDAWLRNWNGLLDDVVIAPLAPPSAWITTWYQQYGGTAGKDPWASATAYVVGDVVRPTDWNGIIYFCVQAGTSAGTEPIWPGVGVSVADNTAVWMGYRESVSFPALPRLHARGRLVAGDGDGVAPVQVIASIDEEAFLQGSDSGTWANDARQIAFTLTEIGELAP